MLDSCNSCYSWLQSFLKRCRNFVVNTPCYRPTPKTAVAMPFDWPGWPTCLLLDLATFPRPAVVPTVATCVLTSRQSFPSDDGRRHTLGARHVVWNLL